MEFITRDERLPRDSIDPNHRSFPRCIGGHFIAQHSGQNFPVPLLSHPKGKVARVYTSLVSSHPRDADCRHAEPSLPIPASLSSSRRLFSSIFPVPPSRRAGHETRPLGGNTSFCLVSTSRFHGVADVCQRADTRVPFPILLFRATTFARNSRRCTLLMAGKGWGHSGEKRRTFGKNARVASAIVIFYRGVF